MLIITNHNDVFELQDNENLLEILEKRGYPMAYQCRSGYCGACRVKKISGEVEYPQPPLAYIGAGEILPCCCKVKTKLILEIENPPIDQNNPQEASN